jgi:hypothetical protein
MPDDSFDHLEQALASGGAAAGFAFLLRTLRSEKKYSQLFEALLMKKRHELGLPLIPTDSLEALPEELRQTYEAGIAEAAREVGSLYLGEGEIARAWPYFRALGDPRPVAAALERLEPGENLDPLIEVAYFERVNPARGLELILKNYGLCRAISCFAQYPDRQGREDCLRVLVRALHAELLENLRQAIARREGSAPEARSIPELVAGRDWLFGEFCYYLDTSHVASVVQFSAESEDPEILSLAYECAEYGSRLSQQFQCRGAPPFDDLFPDHHLYLGALLGKDVEKTIAHFEKRVQEARPELAGSVPAQVLVRLLVRLGRFEQAIDVSLEHLRDVDPAQLTCPSVPQLCRLARKPQRLMKLAREEGNLVNFLGAALEA